jgi:DNA replication protein DnaC
MFKTGVHITLGVLMLSAFLAFTRPSYLLLQSHVELDTEFKVNYGIPTSWYGTPSAPHAVGVRTNSIRLDFLAAADNLVLIGPNGVGKTMIAQNIAHHAVLAGRSVLFTTTARMLSDLGSVYGTPHLFQQRLRKYTRVELLVVDEVGYLSYDTRAADLLFQVVSERHEKRPLVLTTNLPFAQWPTIFPNASCTVALIDRVVHHADIVAIEGDSFRRREAEGRKSARAKNKPAA